MPISTDRFKVVSIRPSAGLEDQEVPEDLRQRIDGRVVTLHDLEELGAHVETARLYHGGESAAVVYWHGNEYVLQLEPASSQD